MIDDPLTLLSLLVWLMAAGMYPLGFLFGACSPCCQGDDDDDGPCPWLLEFDRCLRVSLVDSDPPDGGDCRVFSSVAGSGDFRYMTSNPIQIHRVQSEIRITVRLSLSASGASRTPVGETRTQVWRFNRATPSSPASSAYDVLGPPWHLQLDLSVTGVATQQESGVTSSIGEDEHGQPKLVLNVNQWTSNIVRDEIVTLLPTGLQRWGPGIGDTQTFRLTTNSATATRVEGDAYSGWNVTKLSGLTIDERKLAVRVRGSLCSTGTGGTIVERIILDDDTVVGFLSGDQDVRVSTEPSSLFPSGERDLRILAKNALCESSRDLVGTGVALGIYPEEIYADVPAAVIASNPAWCAETATFALKPSSGVCPTVWSRTAILQRPQLLFPVPTTALLISSVSNFWPGRSLLWNLENGPYRTSFTGTGPSTPSSGWTYRIEGAGSDLEPLFLSPLFGCRPGLVPAMQNTCAPGVIEVSYDEIPIVGFSNRTSVCDVSGVQSICDVPPVTYFESVLPAGTITLSFGSGQIPFSACDATAIGAPNNLFLYMGNSPGVSQAIPWTVLFPDDPTVLEEPLLSARPPEVGFFMRGIAYAEFNPCSVPYTASLRFRGYIQVGTLAVFDSPGVPASGYTPCLSSTQWFNQTGYLNFCERSDASGCATSEHLSDVESTKEVHVAHRLRLLCGPWTPNPLSAGGDTVTRSCDITDGEVTTDTTTETAIVPASRSRFPKTLGRYPNEYGEADQITQLGRCRMLGFRSTTSELTAPPVFVQNPLFANLQGGDCISWFLLFGETNTAVSICTGDPSAITSVPCDNCTPTVTITSGEEYADVKYRASGVRAGTVDVIAKTTWLGGQGVTFTVSCGSDTITQVVRRADTAPTAPRNLTVTRGPCNEAALAWQAPEHDGGQPITAYNIQYRSLTGVFATFGTVAPPALAATVTGLMRLGYEFRVSATNSVGTSAFSNVVTDGFTLAAPTGLTAAPRDPCDAVSLSWTPPSQSQCVVVAEYQVQFRVSGVGAYQTFATVPGTNTTATVTGLTPTTAYQFRIGRVDDANTVLFSNVISVAGCPPE